MTSCTSRTTELGVQGDVWPKLGVGRPDAQVCIVGDFQNGYKALREGSSLNREVRVEQVVSDLRGFLITLQEGQLNPVQESAVNQKRTPVRRR